MNRVELPAWLGAQRGCRRSRAFIIIKLVLFVTLCVGLIEIIFTSPIYYKILENEARKKVGDQADTLVIILSTVASIGYGLVVFSIGIVGTLKERMITLIVFSLLVLIGAIYTLIRFHHHLVLIIAVISNCLVSALALFFAYLVHKSDTKPYNRNLNT